MIWKRFRDTPSPGTFFWTRTLDSGLSIILKITHLLNGPLNKNRDQRSHILTGGFMQRSSNSKHFASIQIPFHIRLHVSPQGWAVGQWHQVTRVRSGFATATRITLNYFELLRSDSCCFGKNVNIIILKC